jgi:hypothetical protein
VSDRGAALALIRDLNMTPLATGHGLPPAPEDHETLV